ncbi:hypothetical protein J2127_000517 [Methanococcus voltae]|uniref:hypothetical protein n=1 Tax=Methanococcus voltae TaxID=2188 RepID=UPI001AEA650F|nr:hypothetical protein [Methanococcus voltae]MBP2143362.1 hypothetical protein [Methanococcus voltae]
MNEVNKKGFEESEKVIRSLYRLNEFMKYIFPESFDRDFVEPTHIYNWGNILQNNKKTAMMAPRGHLKSYHIYAYVMWRIFRAREFGEDWKYISYSETMAKHHLKNIKKLIEKNRYFQNIKNMTDAETIIDYSWDSKNNFRMEPSGILSFKRGWHGTGVICDDILSDPANELNTTIIDKITKIYYEDVKYLPNPNGYLHLVGTPQSDVDLFFKLRDFDEDFKENVNWHKFPAILMIKIKQYFGQKCTLMNN